MNSRDLFCSQFDIREKHTCRKDDKIQLINLQHHLGPNAEAKCVTVNQRRSELLAVGANDVYARVYDRRMMTLGQVRRLRSNSFISIYWICCFSIDFLQSHDQFQDKLSTNCVTYFCPGHLNKVKDGKDDFNNKAITYLAFSPDGTELLVNMGAEQIYLFDINNAKVPVVSIANDAGAFSIDSM